MRPACRGCAEQRKPHLWVTLRCRRCLDRARERMEQRGGGGGIDAPRRSPAYCTMCMFKRGYALGRAARCPRGPHSEQAVAAHCGAFRPSPSDAPAAPGVTRVDGVEVTWTLAHEGVLVSCAGRASVTPLGRGERTAARGTIVPSWRPRGAHAHVPRLRPLLRLRLPGLDAMAAHKLQPNQCPPHTHTEHRAAATHPPAHIHRCPTSC